MPSSACRQSAPVLLVEVDDRLGVGARAEPVALGLEARAQLGVVVDLAVEGDPDRAVLVGHRLVPGRRQVDDRQPPVAEHHAPVGRLPQAGVVGAAVGHGVAHGRHRPPRSSRAVPPKLYWPTIPHMVVSPLTRRSSISPTVTVCHPPRASASRIPRQRRERPVLALVQEHDLAGHEAAGATRAATSSARGGPAIVGVARPQHGRVTGRARTLPSERSEVAPCGGRTSGRAVVAGGKSAAVRASSSRSASVSQLRERLVREAVAGDLVPASDDSRRPRLALAHAFAHHEERRPRAEARRARRDTRRSSRRAVVEGQARRASASPTPSLMSTERGSARAASARSRLFQGGRARGRRHLGGAGGSAGRRPVRPASSPRPRGVRRRHRRLRPLERPGERVVRGGPRSRPSRRARRAPRPPRRRRRCERASAAPRRARPGRPPGPARRARRGERRPESRPRGSPPRGGRRRAPRAARWASPRGGSGG